MTSEMGRALIVVDGASLVRLHPLRTRKDGTEWIVGRAEAGDFVAIPEIGMRVIQGIQAGHRLDQVRTRLKSDDEPSVDIVAFVTQLIDLGFVANVGGNVIPSPSYPPPSLPSVRQEHVRWTLSPALPILVVAILTMALGLVALDPGVFPGYRDLFWSRYRSIVLLGQVATAWSLMLLHELGHLLTARAAGVPGRIRLGTRLQFLVVQTDVTGIWAAPRRHRLTVYLAGMALDLTMASLAIIGLAILRAEGTAMPAILPTVVLTVSSMTPLQLLVFMRTDVYFLIQDLARCRNLYADGSAYVRRLASLVPHRRAEHAARSIGGLPRHERIAVRCYAVLLVLGTSACLVVAATMTVPFSVKLIVGCIHAILYGDFAARLDAVTVMTVTGAFELLWMFAWWRRHGGRVRGWLRRLPSATAGAFLPGQRSGRTAR